MKSLAVSILLIGSIAATAVFAAPPVGAPGGTMAMCKDGTYSSSPEKKGACSGHHGVKDWYGEEAATSTKTTSTTTTAAPMSAAATANPAPSISTTHKISTTSVGKPSAPVAAQLGGGAGQVWANDSSKVYHCSGDKWYGKTKHGEYMSESEAKAKGFRAERGKACS